jgi:hypothetical protein
MLTSEKILDLIVVSLLFFHFFGMIYCYRKIVIPGYISGELQGRGVIFYRDKRPIQFWTVMLFWFLMLLLSILSLLVAINLVIRNAKALGVI